MTHLLPYIVAKIEKHGLKHEIHRFDSGAIMVDIWVKDEFYVIQIYGDSIGLSLITADTSPFDTIPDRSFTHEVQFRKEFEKIFH